MRLAMFKHLWRVDEICRRHITVRGPYPLTTRIYSGQLKDTSDEIATRKDQAVASFVQAIQKLQDKNTEKAKQFFTQAGKFYITSLNEENFEIVGEKLEPFESTANETDVKN